MRAAIYARVSTKDKGQDTENQLRQLREFSARQDWQVFREYIDHETGSTKDRAEFQAMFQDAGRRRFDVVLFWALDRFTREGTLETLQHLNQLSALGVGFKSFTEAYLDSCGIWKDMIIAMLATLAKQERLRLSERVKAGIANAKAKGRRVGRKPVTLDRARLIALHREGRTIREIAATLGCSRSLVHKTLRVSA